MRQRIPKPVVVNRNRPGSRHGRLDSGSLAGRSRMAQATESEVGSGLTSGVRPAGWKPEARRPLPERLRFGVAALSGVDLSGVEVHRGSPEPARLGALALARNGEIFLGPGQDRALAHEAWHTVQQRQGRVRPTAQLAGEPLNDQPALEREADFMGGRAWREGGRVSVPGGATEAFESRLSPHPLKSGPSTGGGGVVQALMNPPSKGNFKDYDEAELQVPSHNAANNPTLALVTNSGVIGPSSSPVDPGGFDDLTQAWATMDDPQGTGFGTQYEITTNWDDPRRHALTRMHAVNSFLGMKTNEARNIFSGTAEYNKKHEQRAESFAKGFVEDQGWQQQTTAKLEDSLNSNDVVGRSTAGLYYKKDATKDQFPVLFYDPGTTVDDIAKSGKFPVIKEDVVNKVALLEYEVSPDYGLTKSTVINQIKTVGEADYQNLNIAGQGGGPAINTETLPVAPASPIDKAADALTKTYATTLNIDLALWLLDPVQVTSGAETATEDLPWDERRVPTVQLKAPKPGAKIEFNFKNKNGKLGPRKKSEFEI